MADNDSDDPADLLSRAEDHRLMGDAVLACDLASQALQSIITRGEHARIPAAAALLGHAQGLVGQVAEAERSFLTAGEFARGLARADVHLTGRPAARWGWFLRTTYRWQDADELLKRSSARCTEAGDQVGAALAQVEIAALELDKKLAGATVLHVNRVLDVLDGEGLVADAAQARLLLCRALSARGRHDEAGATLEGVFDVCHDQGLLLTRIEALTARSARRLTVQDDTRAAEDDARAALELAEPRQLAWHRITALFALAAVDDVSREHAGETPRPQGIPASEASFFGQAARLRSSLENQVFDLHPLRTVEKRTDA